MTPLDTVLDQLEAAVGPLDPRQPVVLDTHSARRGLPSSADWGQHVALPLYLAVAAAREPGRVIEAVSKGVPADWVAELAGVLENGPLLEVGGHFVALLQGEHTFWDDRYGRGELLRASSPLGGQRFQLGFASALFEVSSGIVRTLGSDPAAARQHFGAGYPVWRAQAAQAAAVELWVAIRQRLDLGGVFLHGNVLSPAVQVAPEVFDQLGLQPLRRHFQVSAQTAHGVLETCVTGVGAVGPQRWPVPGSVFDRLHRGRWVQTRLVYEGPGQPGRVTAP